MTTNSENGSYFWQGTATELVGAFGNGGEPASEELAPGRAGGGVRAAKARAEFASGGNRDRVCSDGGGADGTDK